jgi:hypothetical protein
VGVGRLNDLADSGPPSGTGRRGMGRGMGWVAALRRTQARVSLVDLVEMTLAGFGASWQAMGDKLEVSSDLAGLVVGRTRDGRQHAVRWRGSRRQRSPYLVTRLINFGEQLRARSTTNIPY